MASPGMVARALLVLRHRLGCKYLDFHESKSGVTAQYFQDGHGEYFQDGGANLQVGVDDLET